MNPALLLLFNFYFVVSPYHTILLWAVQQVHKLPAFLSTKEGFRNAFFKAPGFFCELYTKYNAINFINIF